MNIKVIPKQKIGILAQFFELDHKGFIIINKIGICDGGVIVEYLGMEIEIVDNSGFKRLDINFKKGDYKTQDEYWHDCQMRTISF